MSDRKKFNIIEELPPDTCELCGEHDELRPYGPNFENICFECAMKDEKTTKRRCSQKWQGVD